MSSRVPGRWRRGWLGWSRFGLVIGVSAQADVPALAGWLTGPLIYAGSAQVATTRIPVN
jgi:hypothetical protein